jgi:hypothetical protein
MGAPTVDGLLDAWEEGIAASHTRRALGLLGAANPGMSSTQLAELSLGERDVALLRLRGDLFGDHVQAIGSCPACGAELDIAFGVSALLGSLPETHGDPGPAEVVVDGYAALVRPPTSSDVLAVLEGEPAREPGARLLDRCVVPITEPSAGRAPAAVAEEIFRLDPGASIELALDCPECAHRWTEVLDVVGFVWAEVNAWARRTLRQVHTLARAYGWRERDILAMTPRRRAAYLGLVAT